MDQIERTAEEFVEQLTEEQRKRFFRSFAHARELSDEWLETYAPKDETGFRSETAGDPYEFPIDPARPIIFDDLKDGAMLERAIADFDREHSMSRFLEILVLLRDSIVWLPFTYKLSDADETRFSEFVQSFEDSEGPDAAIGKTFHHSDEILKIPAECNDGENLFTPVFSDREKCSEFGGEYSVMPIHISDVIDFTQDAEDDAGIVINPLTEPFVLDKEIFDLVLGMI